MKLKELEAKIEKAQKELNLCRMHATRVREHVAHYEHTNAGSEWIRGAKQYLRILNDMQSELEKKYSVLLKDKDLSLIHI